MTKYALLYERLNAEAHRLETVVVHYAEGTITSERRSIIAAPCGDAETLMIAQGWQYRNTPGPQSILMQHA